MRRLESVPGNLISPGGFPGLKSGKRPNVKTANPKKMMMTTGGMLRSVSTYTWASLRTIQLLDSRATPINVPRMMAIVIPTRAAANVFLMPLSSSRPNRRIGVEARVADLETSRGVEEVEVGVDPDGVEVAGEVAEQPADRHEDGEDGNDLGNDSQDVDVAPERRFRRRRSATRWFVPRIPPRNSVQRIRTGPCARADSP